MSDSVRPHRRQPPRLPRPWDSPGKNTGVGCHFLLQGVFPTQGSNPGLPHCRGLLYRLNHQGSPVKSLLGRKEYVWIGTEAVSVQSRALEVVWITYLGHFFRVSSVQSSALSGSAPYLVHLRVLPSVPACSS